MMHWREWLSRIGGLLGGGSKRDRDLIDELRFHRDMLEARYRLQGMDDGQAARAARVALGGEAQIADMWRDQRRLPALDMLAQDLRYGARMLRRAPGFACAVIFTLALGIGANTAIFTVVNAVLLRPLPYAEPDRLVTVGDRTPEGASANVGFATAMDWRARSRTFETLVLMRVWQPTLVVGGEAERVPAVRIGWNYFDMMGIRPALGRSFTIDDDRPDGWRVLLLSDQLWRRRFGADPGVIGRTVVMNDRGYRIIGVMPASFEPLDAARYFAPPQLWAPLGYDASTPGACRSCQHLRAFGRLKPGVTVEQASAEMNAIRDQLRREYPGDYDAGSIAVVPLYEALTGTVRTALYVLLAAVGFVLLIACANVANLLIARSLSRSRELVLRRVLGATPARLVRQLFTESTLLGVSGGLLGLGFAAIAGRALAALAPVSVPRLDAVTLDGRVLAFTVLTTAATTVVFGMLPAWRGGAFAFQQTLAVDSRTSVGNRSRARALLVVADLALALVLLTGAGLMLRTIVALTRANPGFVSDRILTLQFSLVGQAYAEDSAVVNFQNRFLERTRALPSVASVALAGQIPFGGNGDCWGFHAQGRMKPNPAGDPCIERYGSTPDYLRVMGIPLRAGRFFTDADRFATQPVIVVSDSTARAVWGSANPIGALVRIGDPRSGPWRTVIGVVADANHEDVAAPPTAAMYTPQTQITDSFLVAVVKGELDDATKLVGPVRAVMRDLDPGVPVYGISTLEALVAKASAQRLFVMRTLAIFAGLAVLLAAIGLYGVVAYSVGQRVREVAVRLALGATPRHVLRLVLTAGLRLVALGVGAGLVVGAFATRSLKTLVFGVSPLDPISFAAAAAALGGVALAAHWIPIRRALRVNPADALRTE